MGFPGEIGQDWALQFPWSCPICPQQSPCEIHFCMMRTNRPGNLIWHDVLDIGPNVFFNLTSFTSAQPSAIASLHRLDLRKLVLELVLLGGGPLEQEAEAY